MESLYKSADMLASLQGMAIRALTLRQWSDAWELIDATIQYIDAEISSVEFAARLELEALGWGIDTADRAALAWWAAALRAGRVAR